ncbi:hypothetical protein KSC_035230 [Ktedonobacter sp. SOSP1-52]|uniref:VOC family protein n=1 Tax=Ktedonobacter sp. SOSP1-52 TaxID=2778366 RepID=UPI0019151CED|nr:hypothetical protein [Ktedonobacter sp. SOSP1-52]GHO64631.1 hypothetical protein KSC_035230 [Ktedonobacter sp. SOSP1-52]
MPTQSRFTGLTQQVKVPDIEAGRDFYARLFGRDPDVEPHEDFKEWELVPTSWLQLAEGTPEPAGRLRLGVEDLASERIRVQRELGITCSPIERIPGLAAWFNFEDPWGNRLGFFQDLAVNGEPFLPGGSVHDAFAETLGEEA